MLAERCTGFFRLIPDRVATICARFGGYPTDYMNNHDWADMFFDYQLAIQLNQIDQNKEEIKFQNMFNGGKNGKNGK